MSGADAAALSGVECFGLVKACLAGAKVAALIGGLGRAIKGSRAAYNRTPVSSVALIESDLRRAELAAIPETYATAWTGLFRNLKITPGQLLAIRGATSSFGQVAINHPVGADVRVIAGTCNRGRFAILEDLGAGRGELEGPDLSARIPEARQLDAVLDPVGKGAILGSLNMPRRGGRRMAGLIEH